jgi:hypothetical protein
MLSRFKRLWPALGIMAALGCGSEAEHQHAETKFVTGAGPFRGHEDITRMAVELANHELEAELGSRPFPTVLYGLNAVDTDNPLVLGNYQSDFPSSKMRAFYNALNADWHNDGGLQQIHSLRGSENGFYRNNHYSCETQRRTIRTASHKALEAFQNGDRNEGLYWIGHATHVIQDSFSAAHVNRDQRRIIEFCSYGKEFPGTCYHLSVDARDYVWHQGLGSCTLDPNSRDADCLRDEAKWAVEATQGYLRTMGRLIGRSTTELDTPLNDYYSNANVTGQGYFRCEDIPNYPFGISDIKVTSTFDATDRCPSNWESAGADLNDGALGPFIDLCQKYGERPDPITALTVIGKDQSCPDGYERLGQNLNDGTMKKGEKLYACVSRQPGIPLQAVKATSNKKGGNRCGDGWNWIPTDLNKGAGGNYVFLCYR